MFSASLCRLAVMADGHDLTLRPFRFFAQERDPPPPVFTRAFFSSSILLVALTAVVDAFGYVA